MEQARLKYIYLHGTAARVLTSGPPPETRKRVLTYGHSPGLLKQELTLVLSLQLRHDYSEKYKLKPSSLLFNLVVPRVTLKTKGGDVSTEIVQLPIAQYLEDECIRGPGRLRYNRRV